MLIKVLVADDNDVMRGAIVSLLNEEPSTELVGGKGVCSNYSTCLRIRANDLLRFRHEQSCYAHFAELQQSNT
jgi:hypothetical protein